MDNLRHPLVLFHIRVFSELIKRARLIDNGLLVTQQSWDVSEKRLGQKSYRSGASIKKS